MGTVSWLSPLVLVEITDCFYKTGPSSPCINCSLFSCILDFNSYLNLENLFLIVLANIYILCEIYIWNDSFFPLPLGGLLFLMIALMVVWDVPAWRGPFFLSIMRLTSFALSWDLWRDGGGGHTLPIYCILNELLLGQNLNKTKEAVKRCVHTVESDVYWAAERFCEESKIGR